MALAQQQSMPIAVDQCDSIIDSEDQDDDIDIGDANDLIVNTTTTTNITGLIRSRSSDSTHQHRQHTSHSLQPIGKRLRVSCESSSDHRSNQVPQYEHALPRFVPYTASCTRTDHTPTPPSTLTTAATITTLVQPNSPFVVLFNGDGDARQYFGYDDAQCTSARLLAYERHCNNR
jgi:hypothetical protein